LEGVTLAVGIKAAQEGVFFKHLQEQISMERFTDETRQSGLTDPNDTFDGNIHGLRSPEKEIDQRLIYHKQAWYFPPGSLVHLKISKTAQVRIK
jgi:hypothetical protein